MSDWQFMRQNWVLVAIMVLSLLFGNVWLLKDYLRIRNGAIDRGYGHLDEWNNFHFNDESR